MSRDGSKIAALELKPDIDIRVWSSSTGKSTTINQIKQSGYKDDILSPSCMTLSDDGKLLCVGYADDADEPIYVCSTSTGDQVAVIDLGQALREIRSKEPVSQKQAEAAGEALNYNVTAVAFSADNRFVGIVVGNSTLLWDLTAHKVKLLAPAPDVQAPDPQPANGVSFVR
jgi:WD40 repeat protein